MEFFAISLGIVQEYAFELNIRIIVIADDVQSGAKRTVQRPPLFFTT